MAALVTITETELMAALETSIAVASGPAEAVTTQELMDRHHLSREKVLEALKGFGKQGRLVAHQVTRVSPLGLRRSIPAYTILPPKPKRR